VESAFGGSLESGVRFYVVLFGRNLVSVAVKVLSHLIYFIKVFIGLYILFSVLFANVMLCNELYVTEQVYFRQLLWAILGQYKQQNISITMNIQNEPDAEQLPRYVSDFMPLLNTTELHWAPPAVGHACVN
jgi:hypothetical protein